MAVGTDQGTSPHVARFIETVRRIDQALDNRDQQEFADACQQREQILGQLVAEVEAEGLVLFR